jgi:hypothetical protein
MNGPHARGSVRSKVMLAAVLIVAVLALAGCGGTKESPGGPSGTGVSTTRATAVSATVKAAVVKALRKAGVDFDASAVSVTYGMSKSRVVVTGVLKGRSGLGSVKASSGSGVVGYGEIDLTRKSGTWTVTGSKQ